jgi:hypothetical protein
MSHVNTETRIRWKNAEGIGGNYCFFFLVRHVMQVTGSTPLPQVTSTV